MRNHLHTKASKTIEINGFNQINNKVPKIDSCGTPNHELNSTDLSPRYRTVPVDKMLKTE